MNETGEEGEKRNESILNLVQIGFYFSIIKNKKKNTIMHCIQRKKLTSSDSKHRNLSFAY